MVPRLFSVSSLFLYISIHVPLCHVVRNHDNQGKGVIVLWIGQATETECHWFIIFGQTGSRDSCNGSVGRKGVLAKMGHAENFFLFTASILVPGADL